MMFNLDLRQWLSLKYFYQQSGWIAYWLLIIAGVCLLYAFVSGLYLVPADYRQQDAFRIIYVHVPAAFLSLSSYALLGGCSLGYLIWRVKLLDIIAKVSAPLGAAFTALALITGAIWGKPMWGTWWIWDARLTSELILLFLYFGYIGLRNAIEDSKLAAKASALLGVVGLLDLPIIHYSVEWWQTLHQGATVLKFAQPSIATEMLYPLLAAIIGFYAVYLACLLLFARSEILWRERRQSWVDIGNIC